MSKGNAKVKGVMKMTATNRSKYRPKCVIDMKILKTTVEDYCILCHDKTRREKNNCRPRG